MQGQSVLHMKINFVNPNQWPDVKTIFLGDSQQSGTILLQNILCQAPSTNPVLREASYLQRLGCAYKYGKADYGTI